MRATLDAQPALTLASLLAGYLVLALPISGVRRYRALREQSAAVPTVRLAAYRAAVIAYTALAAFTALILGVAGVPLQRVGVTWQLHHVGWMAAGLLAIVPFLAALRTITALARLAARLPIARPAALLPQTPAERTAYAGVAVAAGVVEELLFRAFLIRYFTDVAGLSTQQAVLVSAAAFGLAHVYQGGMGLLFSTSCGLVLGELYVATGSLLLPIVLHAAVDLVELRRSPPSAAAPDAAAACS